MPKYVEGIVTVARSFGDCLFRKRRHANSPLIVGRASTPADGNVRYGGRVPATRTSQLVLSADIRRRTGCPDIIGSRFDHTVARIYFIRYLQPTKASGRGCQARATTLDIGIDCAASADTPQLDTDGATLVCQRWPLRGIDEGAVYYRRARQLYLLPQGQIHAHIMPLFVLRRLPLRPFHAAGNVRSTSGLRGDRGTGVGT